jgi:hypothetical protein
VAETDAPKRPLGPKPRAQETQAVKRSPPVAGILRHFRKSLRRHDCVVGLRGLELRTRHAVAIEPVSVTAPKLQAQGICAGREEVCLGPNAPLPLRQRCPG